jgi:lipopolysaccharide/colanic/teichoic acid biosynthesis glycosyltransferase
VITRILKTGREWLARHRTPLKDAASVRKLIDRERARTLRTGVPFSLILYRAKRSRRAVVSTCRLARVIVSRARSTDEVGWFDDEHLCLLLPDTDNLGAWRVATDVQALLAGKVRKPLFSVYTYTANGFARPERPEASTRRHAQGALSGDEREIRKADRRNDPFDGPPDGNGNGNASGHGGNGHDESSGNGRENRATVRSAHAHDGNGNGNGNGDGNEHGEPPGQWHGTHDVDGGSTGAEFDPDTGPHAVALMTEPPPPPPPAAVTPGFHTTDLLPQLLMTRAQRLTDARPMRVCTTAEVEELLVHQLPRWKRAVDVCGAAAGLIVTAPLLVAIAVVIKLTSPGPVIFDQHRAGLGGRQFRIYKFRTMVMDAERHKAELRAQSEQDGPAFKIKHDPRITPVGRLLRSTSLDELPQLWNVLMGHMSLVGPRPLPMEESDACNAWHRVRLDVTPGITCIWQVRGRSRVTFVEWMRMDMSYIRRRSAWMDLKILIATIPAVLLRRGAQ